MHLTNVKIKNLWGYTIHKTMLVFQKPAYLIKGQEVQYTHMHTQRENSVKVTIIDNQALHGIIHILRVQSALTGVT